MVEDKRTICRCGNAIAELMSDNEQLKKNMDNLIFENIENMDLQKIRTTIFNNYNLIHKVRESCNLDTREEEDISDKNFVEAVFLVRSEDRSAFSVHRGTISSNIRKIDTGIQRKIKECSQL